jgi:hypothetical protein
MQTHGYIGTFTQQTTPHTRIKNQKTQQSSLGNKKINTILE